LAAAATPDLEADIDDILNRGDLPETERMTLIKTRLGRGLYRKQVMELWQGRCAVTGCSEVAVLEACHLKPWKDSTGPERVDPENGICLDSNLHRLLDSGLITFDDEGLIRISERLLPKDRIILKLEEGLRIKKTLTDKQKAFLKVHRETFE
jgi:predicted restriction endonuclease